MNYFKILSIVIGAWMIIGGAWVAFSMESWKRFAFKLCPEERPRWLVMSGVVVLVWVLWTWVEFVRAVSMANFVVTLVVSLSLVKTAPFVFFYKKARGFLMALISETLALRVVMLSTAAIGAALLAMGLFF